MADGQENDERMAMDVPLLGHGLGDASRDAAAQAAYITGIRQAIQEAFDRPDLLARYTQNWNDIAMARPYFSLPSSASPEVLPESEESIISLTTPRALELRPRDDGALDIAVNSKPVHFRRGSAAAAGLFSAASCAWRRYPQFYQRFADQYERDTLRQFLTEMAKHGVVIVRQPLPGVKKRSNRASCYFKRL